MNSRRGTTDNGLGRATATAAAVKNENISISSVRFICPSFSALIIAQFTGTNRGNENEMKSEIANSTSNILTNGNKQTNWRRNDTKVHKMKTATEIKFCKHLAKRYKVYLNSLFCLNKQNLTKTQGCRTAHNVVAVVVMQDDKECIETETFAMHFVSNRKRS